MINHIILLISDEVLPCTTRTALFCQEIALLDRIDLTVLYHQLESMAYISDDPVTADYYTSLSEIAKVSANEI